jgi:haloacetate dehalogenase
MFEGFSEFDIAVSNSPDVTIHGIRSGNGEPLLLLHGFPQTHHMWHLVAPQLASVFTVICIDLRGYGRSSKPASSSSAKHAPYSKSSMARDCVAVMAHFGFQSFSILAHDRGARVAHKLCVDYPERARRLVMLDICPTLTMYEATNQDFATAYWHWFFLVQPAPFPETLILKNRDVFREKFFGGAGYSGGKEEYHPEAMREYLAQLVDPEAVHAMCEDYRAAATVDLEEAREDREKGRKIKCPVRVLWGKKAVIERCFDALKEWRAVSEGPVDGEAVDSGHYVAEEVPDVVLKNAMEFFG